MRNSSKMYNMHTKQIHKLLFKIYYVLIGLLILMKHPENIRKKNL